MEFWQEIWTNSFRVPSFCQIYSKNVLDVQNSIGCLKKGRQQRIISVICPKCYKHWQYTLVLQLIVAAYYILTQKVYFQVKIFSIMSYLQILMYVIVWPIMIRTPTLKNIIVKFKNFSELPNSSKSKNYYQFL